MLRLLLITSFACGVGLTDAAAEVLGTVEGASPRYTEDGELIVTESTIRLADGQLVSVVELGGTVNGIGMRFSHTRSPLHAGQRVRVSRGRDGSYRVAARIESTPASARADAGAALYSVERTGASERPLWLEDGCVQFYIDSEGVNETREGEILGLFELALGSWEESASGCGELALAVEPASETSKAARDGYRTIQFRSREWCRPATAFEPRICYPDGAAAVTRLIFVDDPAAENDGMILEADIDFNSVEFSFRGEVDGRQAIDFLSVATHEIGHALGIGHNCRAPGDGDLRDHAGEPVPPCETVADGTAAKEATMYYAISAGESHKRSLEAADILAACKLTAGRHCEGAVTGGCSAGSSRPTWLAILLILLATLRIRYPRRHENPHRSRRPRGN